MKFIGDLLELAGALITAGGLVYAWHRMTDHVNNWRRQLVRLGEELKAKITGRRSATVQVAAAAAGAGMHTATVRVEYPVDTTAPLEDQVARLIEVTKVLRSDVESTERKIDEVRDNPAVTPDDVETAIAEALSGLEDTRKISAVRDLRYALFGILITAVGISLGLLG